MALFGTDGIRARAGEGPLAAANVRRLGMAVSYLLKNRPNLFHSPVPDWFTERHRVTKTNIIGKGRVLIARDTRASGPEIEKTLVEGLSDFGASPLLAGVLPTPGAAQLTRLWSCALGVVISASHNPPEDNGIKLLSPEGLKVPDDAEAELEKIVLDPHFNPTLKQSKAHRAERIREAGKRVDDYVKFLREQIDEGVSLKGMSVVVDCANGAASPYASELLRKLGVQATILHDKPDGTNINRECGAIHPAVIARKTAELGADLGASFDGDGDRAMLADEKGGIVDGDHVLAMHAADLDARGALPGRAVVSTVMANHGLERFLAERGLRLVRTPVGDRWVAEEMLRSGARLGGEPSGHIIFLDSAPSGDGMLVMLRTLALLRRAGRKLSELAAGLVKYPQLLLNVPVKEKPPLEEVAPVRRALALAENALAGNGRIVLRYSGTEPLCRVMVEGPDEPTVRRLAESVAGAVRESLGNSR